MKRFFMATAVVFSLFLCSSSAYSFIISCPACSNIFTQLIEKATSLQQYAENIKQTINQVQMIKNEIEQYENMIRNTEGLSLEDLTDVKGLLNGLSGSGSRLEVMRADIGAMKTMVEDLYPDYSQLTKFSEKEEEQLDEMSRQVDKATMATFQATGSQLEAMQDSDEYDEHINSLLESPEGQMQALSSANHLSSLQLQEYRLLREAVLTQAQAEATIQAREEKEKQIQTSLEREFMKEPENWELQSNDDPF